MKYLWTNIPTHVDDKGNTGMPCMHVVSRYVLHMILDLVGLLCNLIML